MLDTLHTAVALCSHGMGWSAERGRGGFGTNQNFLALLPTLFNTGLFLEVLLVLCALGTASPPSALPPAGGSYCSDKTREKPATIRAGWRFCCFRPKSSAAGRSRSSRDSSVQLWALEGLHPSPSLDQEENKDVCPAG